VIMDGAVARTNTVYPIMAVVQTLGHADEFGTV
jgi:hypothetical protein